MRVGDLDGIRQGRRAAALVVDDLFGLLGIVNAPSDRERKVTVVVVDVGEGVDGEKSDEKQKRSGGSGDGGHD